MDEATEAFLRTFYRALVDRPLEPDDGWYVPIYENAAVSRSDPAKRLARVIRWAPQESVQLFGGFRGTGKSTELRRLRRLLEAQGFEVVLCDMGHYLDLSTPIDLSDFLISAAGALSDALAERLREAPPFRRRLQERTHGHLGRLIEDVQHYMAECVAAVRKQHGDDTELVVLFDSIDHIRGTSANQVEVFESLQRLFAGCPDALRFAGVHVIYTVPPWLKMRSPGVTRLYDAACWLPCVKTRHREGESFGPGLEVLKKIVRARGDWAQVLAGPDDLEHVLLETGGCLRDLFRALQGMLMAVADRGGGRLDREAIELELAELRNDRLSKRAGRRWELGITSDFARDRGAGLGEWIVGAMGGDADRVRHGLLWVRDGGRPH